MKTVQATYQDATAFYNKIALWFRWHCPDCGDENMSQLGKNACTKCGAEINVQDKDA